MNKISKLALTALLSFAVSVPFGFYFKNRQNIKPLEVKITEQAQPVQIPIPILDPVFSARREYFEKSQDELVKKAAASLEKGIEFYSKLDVRQGEGGWNTPGGYSHSYSLDLKTRFGRDGTETSTSATLIEPGTPTIGSDFLLAFKTTGNSKYLEAAEKSGRALIIGQLKDGGWGGLDFNQERKAKYDRYKECLALKKAWKEGKKVNYNQNLDNPSKMSIGTFKERVMQRAIDYMIDLDAVTHLPEFHNSARKGLDFLIEAQLPAGGWAMQYPFEEREGRKQDDIIVNRYSFNDGGTNSCIQTLLKAWQTYKDPKYFQALMKGADFLLESQTSDGGWATHYTYDLKPAWGRGQPGRGGLGMGFEPPANDSGVTAESVKTLSLLYLETGDTRYFETAKKGKDWLMKVRMDGDYWAGFYELGTNRAIYQKVTDNWRGITYDAKEMAFNDGLYHIAFENINPTYFLNPELFCSLSTYKHGSRALQLFDYLTKQGRSNVLFKINNPSFADIETRIKELEPVVGEITEKQGEDGRWLDNTNTQMFMDGYDFPDIYSDVANEVIHSYSNVVGKRVQTRISSANFDANVRVLSEYLGLRMRYDLMTRAGSKPTSTIFTPRSAPKIGGYAMGGEKLTPRDANRKAYQEFVAAQGRGRGN